MFDNNKKILLMSIQELFLSPHNFNKKDIDVK